MYNANNWGDKYKLLGVIGPFGPRVGELYVSWCLHWYCIYCANNWGVVCNLLFTLVLYIEIGGIHISCSVCLGPPGPVYGCMSVGF